VTNSPEYGFICFAYTNNKWYDWCIAKFSKSSWSHSFFTCPPMLGEEMVMEADSSGVSVCSFDQHYRQNSTQTYKVFRFKNVDQATIDAAIKNRIPELEVTYGYLEYPWFIWRYLNRMVGRDIKAQDNWCQNGNEVCSQFLREYISDCGYASLFDGYGKGSMAPEDIYQVVLAHPELFELVESKP